MKNSLTNPLTLLTDYKKINRSQIQIEFQQSLLANSNSITVYYVFFLF